MDDDIDTDAVCKKAVTLFYITIEDVEKLRNKYMQCERFLHEHEMKLVNPDIEEPVIDYIIKDNLTNKYFCRADENSKEYHNYDKE